MSKPETVPQYIDDGSLHGPVFANLELQDWPTQIPLDSDTTGLHLVASDGALLEAEPKQYRIGESHLPIAPYREQYLQTIAEHRKAVVSAETGSGKSTNLALFLLEAGVPKVYVSEPRILATRELKERGRQNLTEEYGHLVGNLTGNAADTDCPEDARIIYITQDLLFKLVSRGQIEPDAHIIIDEAHEKGSGTIFLIERANTLVNKTPGMGLTVTSATIDEEKFANKIQAPILRFPGRSYPIEEHESLEKVGTTQRFWMKRPRSKNTMAFEPSTARMRDTANTAQSRMQHDHTVHMLYGDQSPREQKKALNPADGHHIVATRVGETSITPENKDVVIDSTLSNIGGFEAGVRTLTTVWSSKATMKQRKGRVGRTKPGIYVVAQPDNAPPLPNYVDRPDYDPSEIENSSVASYLLELRRSGLRIKDLDLLERPTEENLRYDERLLRRLGAIPLDDETGIGITEIGVALTDLCLDPPEARMLVEARQYTQAENGTYTDAVRLQVAAAVSVQQVTGLLDTGPGTKNRYMGNGLVAPLSSEQSSDFLFELDVFTELLAKQRALEKSGAKDWEDHFEKLFSKYDILPNRYYKAVRTFEELCRREAIDPLTLSKATKEQRRQIIDCQIVATPELFVQRGVRTFSDIRGDRGRTLGKASTIHSTIGGLVVGTAFNYRGLTKNGRYERRSVSGGSAADAEQLMRKAPERVSKQTLGLGVNRRGRLMQRQALFFDNELKFADIEAELPPTIETRRELIRAMMIGEAPDMKKPGTLVSYRPETPNAMAAIKKWRYAQTIEERTQVKLDIGKRYENLINKVIRDSLEADEQGNMRFSLDITSPDQLDEIIPKVYISSIVKPSRRKRTLPNIAMASPDGISIHVGEDHKDYIDVHYKNNVAYVSIPRDCKFTIRREDFSALASNHDVKLRIANGKYAHLDVALEKIDSERGAAIERQRRRNERQAEMTQASQRNAHKEENRMKQQRQKDEGVRTKKAMQLAARAKEVRSNRKVKKLARYALESI